MDKLKLNLDNLEIDSFHTVGEPTPRAGTVFGNVPTAECTDEEPSYDAGCTIGCVTNTNGDGPTCGRANCTRGTTGGGATGINQPSCYPNYTCAASCIQTCAGVTTCV